MPRLVWVVAPWLFVALTAHAEIFKCTSKNGTVLYQNFKCEIDSMGSLPSAPTPQAPIPVAKENAPAAANTSSNANADVKVATARPQSGALRVGMTMDEVRALLGEPTESFQDELVEGRVEIWAYGSARSVKFNLSGRVIEITQQ